MARRAPTRFEPLDRRLAARILQLRQVPLRPDLRLGGSICIFHAPVPEHLHRPSALQHGKPVTNALCASADGNGD